MSAKPAEADIASQGGFGRFVTSILCTIGIGVSSYLLWLHLGGSPALCTGFGGCDVVNASPYAVMAGVPVSLIGMIGYVAILGLSLWRAGDAPWGVSFVIFGMALVGVLFSIYLTYLELFVILAVCPWCVTSALLMTGVLADSWRWLGI